MNEFVQIVFNILAFVLVWIYSTTYYIPNKIEEQCKTGRKTSNAIFWGTIGITVVIELICTVIFVLISYTFN